MALEHEVPWSARDTRSVVAITGLAFALRAVLAALTDVVATDGPHFLLFAEEIGRGRWGTWLERGVHPGYPVAIAMVGPLVGGLERAAYVVSALFGALTVLPFYALVRDMAGRRVAGVAGLLLACLPYFVMEHADVMSEGLFHFLFVAALWLAWRAVHEGRVSWFALAAWPAAFAYFTRPEGAYLPIAVLGLCAMKLAVTREPPARVILGALAFVAVLVMLASPLLIYWKQRAGEWKVTCRASADAAMRALRHPQAPVREGNPHTGAWSSALAQMGHQLKLATLWFVAPLAAAGLLLGRGRMRRLSALFLLCIAAGYLVPPLLAGSQGHAISRRYVLVPVLFLLPFSALGCVALADAASARWRSPHVARVAAAALGLALTTMAVVTVRPRRVEDRPIKEAARWVHEHAPPDTAVHSNSNKASWYLGRPVAPLADAGPGAYVIVVERELRGAVDAGGRRVASFTGVAVYVREPVTR